MTKPVYERIVDLFEAEGIDTLFGIPDPGFIHMVMLARDRGWNVIAPHHEQGGAFMADAWSRMTGKPGLCFGTAGPGVANLAAAMIVAAKENSPTIFMGANRMRSAEERVKRGRIQYISQPKLMAPAMKYVGVLEYAEQTDDIFHHALRKAQSGTPGPVYIEIPMHVIETEMNWPPILKPSDYRLDHQQAATDMVEKAAAYIRAAKQPMILMGQGVFTARAQSEVAKLARLVNCPIVRTTGTDAYLPGLEDRVFPYGFTPIGREAVVESDLCIAIGTEIGEPIHNGLGRHWAKKNDIRKWIYIERDPEAIGINRPIDAPLVGDLRDVVPQLTASLGGVQREMTAECKGWIRAHAEYKRDLVVNAPKAKNGIHTARMVIEATKNLPPDTVMVRDGGAVSIFGWTYPQNTPHDMVWNQNLGHLGTGLPYAIGAQVAVGPERRVVLITSDSTFLFHTTELETAARKNLPVVCVVGVDHAWGLEVGAARAIFGPDVDPVETFWGKEVRFDKLAEALGCHGEFVEHEQDISPAVERALASGKPAVVHVVIDPDANANEAPGWEEFQSWYSDTGIWVDQALIT